MKKIILLFSLLVLSSSIFAQEKLYETDTFRKRMEDFKKDPLTEGCIVFLGNSITQGGKWDSYFPTQKPMNRGISGDNTDGMLFRLGEIVESKPSKLFFMGGVNDISQNQTNEAILKNIEAIIHRMKQESPTTQIYIQSLLPINGSFLRYKKLLNKEKQIVQMNKKLKALCKKEKVTFVNIYPLFLLKKNLLDPQYSSDGLHLNEAGYAVWARALSDLVEH